MDLTFSRNNCLNTIISTEDGRPLYHVNTRSKVFGTAETRITTVQHGAEAEVNTIKWNTWSSDPVLRVNGERLVMHSRALSSSTSFEGSDGEFYKWKIDKRSPWLIIDDRSHTFTTVATFKRAKSGRPATLKVSSIGVPIIDEIVTSFLWYEQKRRRSSLTGEGVLQGVSETLGSSN